VSYAIGGESAYYEAPDAPGPECQWCDGGGWVGVSAIVDCVGSVHPLPQDSQYSQRPYEIRCPRCLDEPGVEPPNGKKGGGGTCAK
jgi:hypothetical protein